jgi:uncharacterized repeat protein (TIGR01451 family)
MKSISARLESFASQWRMGLLVQVLALALPLVVALAPAGELAAQDLLQPGETYVTRFSGTASEGGRTVIDVNGTVGSILDVRNPATPPVGQHWRDVPQRLPVTALQVGQVFGVALDGQTPPNVYLTATSAFGLHRNDDNSNWMNGQWGQDGGPATIWKLNAENGYQPEHFADLTLDGRGNTGAALGNIAYDRWHDQLFVSDLETGMIHRLRRNDGSDLGHYDHGTQGRVSFYDVPAGATGALPAVAFNPATEALTAACPFGVFAQTPNCWNFAVFRRRIWGLGVHRDGKSGTVRLYYAVWGSQSFGHPDWAAAGDDQRNAVWSVGLAANGDFSAADVRRELFLPDFFTTPADLMRAGVSNPVADIAFPQCADDNVMILAERGGVRNLGLDAESPFAWPHEARVLRYERDANGVWQPIGRYDVGHYRRGDAPAIRVNATGGAAFGFHYTPSWQIDPAQPDRFLWMTGDNLCSPEGPCTDPASGQRTDTDQVSGEQGAPAELHTAIDAATPETADVPGGSYMVDTDVANDPGRNDATKIGDVAIYEPCGAGQRAEGGVPGGPGIVPPGLVPPGHVPPGGMCPRDLLQIDKTLGECHPEGGLCTFHITVTNVSDEPYVGPIYVNDLVPAGTAPLVPLASAGWNCLPLGGAVISCSSDPTVIPGIPAHGSVSFDIYVGLPPGLPPGTLNCAEIVWPMDAPALPGGDLAPGGTWEVAWVELALIQRGLLGALFFDGVYDAGNPADPTQQAIDNLLGTAPGTGTLAQAQAALFPGSAGLHADCNGDNDRDCVPITPPGQPGQPGRDLGLYKFQQECTTDGAGGFFCRFGIDITNNGPGDYVGPLHLHDALPPAASFQGVAAASPGLAGIACGPVGAAVIDCVVPMPPGVNIPVGGVEWLDVWVHTPAPMNDAQNCVELGLPTHEGDPDNAGNNMACAPLPAPQILLNAPLQGVPDLAVAKTGPAQCTVGGTCTYQVTITNNGPGVYTGPLNVSDLPTGVPGVTFVSASPGWTCTVVGGVGAVSCQHAPVTLNAGQSVTLSITLQLPPTINPNTDVLSNCTWLLDANPQLQQGGSLEGLRKYALSDETPGRADAPSCLVEPLAGRRLAQLTGGTASDATTPRHRKPMSSFRRDGNQQNNHSCTKTRIVIPARAPHYTPPLQLDCWQGWQQVASGWRRAGWEVKLRQEGKQSVLCAHRLATPTPVTPVAPACPTTYRRFDSQRLAPQGWQGFALRVAGQVAGWCARPAPVVEPPRCDAGWRQFDNPRVIPQGWEWTKKTRGAVTIFCAKPRSTQPIRCGACQTPDAKSKACVCNRQCVGGAVLDPRTCTCGACPASRPLRSEPRACVTACNPAAAEQPACTGGRIRRGDLCVCPGKTYWDPKMNRCMAQLRPIPSPVVCTGGQIREGRRCVCPGRTQWDSRAGKCVTRAAGQPTPTERPCPKGQVRVGGKCVPQMVKPVRPLKPLKPLKPIRPIRPSTQTVPELKAKPMLKVQPKLQLQPMQKLQKLQQAAPQIK